MAKPRPEKKAEPAANATTRVLPMELKVGDHITDEAGEGRPRRASDDAPRAGVLSNHASSHARPARVGSAYSRSGRLAKCNPYQPRWVRRQRA